MDTTKTEELLESFEQEIKSISEIALILKSIEELHQELKSSASEHKSSAVDLKIVSLKVSTLTENLSNKIDENESSLKDALLSLNQEIKSGLETQVSILKNQTKTIEDTVQSQLHIALSRYETFVRGELLSVKDRAELDFKELKNIMNQNTSKITSRMTILFWVLILFILGLAIFIFQMIL